ncbi:hypothetical protein [Actinomadura litoris]|uniref:Transposase n=1 Tax=Actinomadura litoris TaxID=2678616 RepID=A0A7K1LD73_9ACTN|nr:hypothetical protein [Actinomadura litoris]MUN42377.1 hypothetical protein [Actinomadura litoris]
MSSATGYKFKSEPFLRHAAEGEARGRAEGEARGRAEGTARAILVVLAARGLAVSEEAHERIMACRDIGTLSGWLVSATMCESTDGYFGSPSSLRRPDASRT